jgi:hypothetical protein
MKTKNVQTKNVVETTKNVETKTNVELTKQQIENRQIEINKLLTMLKNATQRHEKCRIRNRLRKLNHFGALRNRTYFDKTKNETIIVERTSNE